MRYHHENRDCAAGWYGDAKFGSYGRVIISADHCDAWHLHYDPAEETLEALPLTCTEKSP